MRFSSEQRHAFATALTDAVVTCDKQLSELARALDTVPSSLVAWCQGSGTPETANLVFTLERELGVPAGYLSSKLGFMPVPPSALPTVEELVRADMTIPPRERRAILALVEVARGAA